MEHSFDPSQDIRFSVGELSEMYGVTSRTLRLYHERGLLVPERIDTRTGYRYYSTSQLPRLEMILQMKNVGLSLKRIENILETKDLSVFEALLNEQIDELDEKISRYTTRARRSRASSTAAASCAIRPRSTIFSSSSSPSAAQSPSISTNTTSAATTVRSLPGSSGSTASARR